MQRQPVKITTSFKEATLGGTKMDFSDGLVIGIGSNGQVDFSENGETIGHFSDAKELFDLLKSTKKRGE